MQLGRIDLAILIDCTEQFCRDALRRRYQKDKEEGAERAGKLDYLEGFQQNPHFLCRWRRRSGPSAINAV